MSSTMSTTLAKSCGSMSGQTVARRAFLWGVSKRDLSACSHDYKCGRDGLQPFGGLGHRRNVADAPLAVHFCPSTLNILFELLCEKANAEKGADADGADEG